MRRRRRARGPDRLLHRLARHLAVPERPDRPPLRDRQERRGPEQVLLGRPDRLGHRDRRRLERHAPDDRDRHPRRLAHREPARGRHLVGERHDRRLELAAVVVGGAAEVDERRDARAADRDVHDAATPGPAERVRDHDGDLDAEPFAQLAAEPLRRAVRVLRQQREEPLLDVGGVDARVRAHEPVAGLGDHEVAAPGDDAPRLPLDPGLAAAVVLGDDAALGLGHDLLRHRDHVAVANAHRAERSGEERREVVARPDLRESLDGQHLDAHAVRRRSDHPSRPSANRASASAFASSVMIESVAPARTPVASIRGISARSASSTTQAAEEPPVVLGRAGRRDLGAGRRHQAVRHPRERRAGDDPAHADDVRAPMRDGVADPRHREDRTERGDRVRRAQHDRVRVRQRLEDPGRGPRAFGALVPDGLDLVASPAPDPVLLEVEVELLAVGDHRDPRGHRVVAHRQQTRHHAEPPGDGAPSPRSASRPPPGGSSGTGGSRGRGRRG